MLNPVDRFKGLYVFSPKLHLDSRGYFFESFNIKDFEEAGINFVVKQQNQSCSSKGTIRGLHYQYGEHAQSKFIRVLRGEILDVVVDIRTSSPTYGEHFSIKLDDENKKGLYIPKGFAHGFCALSESVEIFYCCDNLYDPLVEGGILYNDPDLGIDWIIDEEYRLVSKKDLSQQSFINYKNAARF